MNPEGIFDEAPEEKYAQILQVADPDVVKNNLMKYFRRMAIMEKLLEEQGLDEKVDELEYIPDIDIDNRLMGILLESMSTIVASHER